ncbi:MAG: STAS/SEC14 domain-containing protein [Aliiglaciecola sp.]|uniref:STAS/SEC14 domain-containing protein n=1 Tax=Aliiglaciecola sp. TaxID=1872441 RepID=UPI0032985CE1
MKTPLGSYEFKVEGRIVYQTFTGMFSGKTARTYLRETKQLITQFEGKAFCMLIDIREMEGLTPDGYNMIDNFNQWVNTQNLVAKAIVVSNDVVGKIVSSRVPELKKQNVKYFEDIQTAIKWVNNINIEKG